MNSFEIAKALIGSSSSRSGNTASHKASQTTTIFGTATSDSEDGKVRVLFDGDSTGTDEDGSIEVSTTFSIKEGDTVIVSLIGSDGTGKYPIVVGVEGRGDEQQGEIKMAQETADSAVKITPQHFFYNSEGAFVTSDEVTCDTFSGDGVVTDFTLSGTPYDNLLLALYVAGASVTSGYSVSGAVLTFDSAPTGSIVALWSETEMQDYAKMDSDSFDIVKEADTVASFGREVTVGNRDSSGAVGRYSQVFGQKCTASGVFARASGFNSIAASDYQEVIGRNNLADNTGTYAFIVGNGDSSTYTKTLVTDKNTTSFTVPYEPERIISSKVEGQLDLGNYLDGYDPIISYIRKVNVGIITTLEVGLSQELDYDLPLLIILEDNSGHSYKQVKIPAGALVLSTSGNIFGNVTHVFTLFVDKGEYNNTFFYFGHAITDGFTVSADTSTSFFRVTLINEAAYWAQIFSGLSITYKYTYVGVTNRSNAMTLDWYGNENIAGMLNGIKKVKLCDVNFTTTSTLDINFTVSTINSGRETIVPKVGNVFLSTFYNSFSAGRVTPSIGRPVIYEIIGTRNSSTANLNRYTTYDKRIVEANVTTAGYYVRSTQLLRVNTSSAAYGTPAFYANKLLGSTFSTYVEGLTDDSTLEFKIQIPKTGGGRLQVIAYSIGLGDDYDEV